MSHISISDDKQRIITQLQVNLQNMPDDPDKVAQLLPQLKSQARGILESISPSDFRPAEVMALLSLVGPILSRTPVTVRPKQKRRFLRSV